MTDAEAMAIAITKSDSELMRLIRIGRQIRAQQGPPSHAEIDAAPRTINYVEPPVQRPGYVEQVVRTYEAPAKEKPQKKAAEPKHKAAGKRRRRSSG